jgi:hypothetical protein
MLSEYRHTLGMSPINRKLQRSSVPAIFETSIDLVITQELRHDGGVSFDGRRALSNAWPRCLTVGS